MTLEEKREFLERFSVAALKNKPIDVSVEEMDVLTAALMGLDWTDDTIGAEPTEH